MIAPPVAREEAVFRRKHPPDVFFAVPLRAVSCQHVRRKKGEFLFHGIFGIVAAELIGRFDNLQHRVGEARIVNAVQNAPYNRRLLRRRRNDPRFAVDQLCKGFNLRRVRHISRHRPARRKKNGGRLVYLFKRSGGRVLRLVRRTAPAPRHKRRKKGGDGQQRNRKGDATAKHCPPPSLCLYPPGLVCAGCLLDYVTARHFANKLPVRVLQDGKRPARPIRRHCSTSAAGRESHHSGLFRNCSFAQASQFSAVQEEQ